MTAPSRISRRRLIEQLRLVARKGDRAALTLAVEQMRTLAYSPRYWRTYLELLANPLARLVDLLVIKQGDKIAHQKGWVKPKRGPRKPKPVPGRGRPGRARRGTRPAVSAQPSLFPEL